MCFYTTGIFFFLQKKKGGGIFVARSFSKAQHFEKNAKCRGFHSVFQSKIVYMYTLFFIKVLVKPNPLGSILVTFLIQMHILTISN